MRELVNGLEEEAKKFSAKSYARMTHNSIDYMAGYIRDHHGLVSGVLGDNAGWRASDGIVKPPISKDWGHALYFCAAKMINGKKYVGGPNSWGNGWGGNGWFWIGADYFGSLFNLWTLIDNTKKMQKLIGDNLNKKDLYAIGEDGQIRLIYNLTTLDEGHRAGMWDKSQEIEWIDGIMVKYIRGKDIIFLENE